MKSFIILLGPPGSGKGTLAKPLSEKLSVPHISTGDILRESVKKEGPLSKEIREVMAKGELVSDELLEKIIRERLNKNDCKEGFILDGYPRNLNQCKTIEQIMTEKGIFDRSIVIEFKVSDEEIIKRLVNRRSCPNCGAIYNIVTSPPSNDNLCNNCNIELVQREDDKEETVRQRLRVYYENTQPIVDFFKKRNKLVELDGSKSPIEVLNKALEIIH